MIRRIREYFEDRRLGLPRNPALCKAIKRVARSDSPRNRAQLRRAFRQAQLILATVNEVSGDQKLSFKIVKDEQGHKVLPAFTDRASFLAWYTDGSPFVALAAGQVARLVAEDKVDRLALNPAGPIWGVFSRNDLISFFAEGQGQAAPTRG